MSTPDRCKTLLVYKSVHHQNTAQIAREISGVLGADEPAEAERRLRTTNGLERLNKEIKRRTRVATLFPNEALLLRLASAVLSEISNDWETERACLTMEAR
jgi:transposase-like protein